MGGPIAFRTAAAVPDRVGAVTSFHGGELATDAPNSPHLQGAFAISLGVSALRQECPRNIVGSRQ
jgi:dienelactone hydrolase